MVTKEIQGLDYIDNIENATHLMKVLEKLKDKVTNSPEYLLLYGKTQMFYDNKGRSRGGHSDNIGNTAKSMASKTFEKIYSNEKKKDVDLYELNLEINKLYAEIMGLSHDLGHTPLGHDGESVLNKKLSQMTRNDEELRQQVLEERQQVFSGITMEIDEKTAETIRKKDKIDIEPGVYQYEEFQEIKRAQKGEKGIGFEHNEYSAQIFSRIFSELSQELVGTEYENTIGKIDKNRFMTAILAHSRSRFPAIPNDYLAQIVRQSDKVEYMNYDFEEYYQMGCFPLEKTQENEEQYENFNKILKERAEKYKVSETELREYLLLSGEERRENLEDDMVNEALEDKGKIDDKMNSMKMSKICAEFKDDTLFYIDENGKRGLITGNNVEREEVIIDRLVEFYRDNPNRIPNQNIVTDISPLNEEEISNCKVVSFSQKNVSQNQYEQLKSYIASFTNEKCEEIYQELVQERIQYGQGHGICPVTKEEIDETIKKCKQNSNAKTKADSLTLQEKSQKTFAYLPENIKSIIEKNRILHEKQVENDENLYQKMLKFDKERESQKIQEMHDQKSEQFFEDIETGKYNVPETYIEEKNNLDGSGKSGKQDGKFNIADFQELSETRRKENVAQVTHETITGVTKEQTKEEVMLGEER